MSENGPFLRPKDSRRSPPRIRFGLGLFLVAAASACSNPGADHAGIRTVVLDLEGMDPAVAAQLQAARSIAEDSPLDAAGAEAWGVLGETCHAYTLYDSAATAYGNATALAPDDARWWYLLGVTAMEQNKIEEAAPAVGRAIELAPDQSSPVVTLARLELLQGHTDEAATLARRAISIDGDDMGAWLVLAETEAAQNRVQEAVDAYRTILQRQPEATKIIAPLTALLRRLGSHDKATTLQFRAGDQPVAHRDPWLERVVARRRGFDAETQRAVRFFDLGRYREAANGFEAALALRPDDGPTMVNLGGCLLKLGEFDAAAEVFAEAVTLHPEDPIAWFNLGSADVGRGNDAAAVEAYQRSIALRPDSLRARGELGDALSRLGLCDEALDSYESILDDRPDLEPALVGGAVCLVRLERFVEARSWLKDALGRRPQSSALAGLAARLLATADDPAARDGEQALKVARQLEQILPAPIHLELVGLALAETGRYSEAISKTDEALAALGEGNPELRDRLQRERRTYEGAAPVRKFGDTDLYIRDAAAMRRRQPRSN